MGNLKLRIEDRIAILEFDSPESKVNVLNTPTMQELADLLDQVSSKSKSAVEALVITSSKEGIFIAGADIKEIEHINSADEAKEKANKGKEILDRIEKLDILTVAAINGACLGGGLELALACKYRIASFSDSVKMGLPEVNLGIIPGFGGTQRLPKIIGLSKALNMILSGQAVSGKDALKYGLVDRLFPAVSLSDEAIIFVRKLLSGETRIIRKKEKKKFIQKFLEDTPFGREVLFNQAKVDVLKRTKGFYPAPLKAIEVIRKTYGRDMKRGFLLESGAFGELAITQVSKNLIKVFYLNEEFKKLLWADIKPEPTPFSKCGIVGAGIMGGGIAQLTSFHDIPTRLKDINYDALKKALKTASELFEYAVKKRKLKRHEADYKFGLISTALTYRGFENADIIIEAVVEDLNIKKKVFKELMSLSGPKSVLASNTSSLPIIEMAKATDSPERVIGLHFFNPVHRMPLIEIIKSIKTSDETLSRTIAFARRIGKVVIVVNDVPGFLINRILFAYLNEAGFLVEEGMRVDQVDAIARKFGMPVGPIELIDEVGIDVGYKVAKILESSYGKRMAVSSILEKAAHNGLLGKKSNKGFYIHKGKQKRPNPLIYNFIEKRNSDAVSEDDALKRMMYTMINEASRCLEENVADRPQTVDIGMIMGTGFPPFRAGLLRYADAIGIEIIVKALKTFETELNAERLKPCNYLIKRGEKREGFYGPF